jgi:preprotein translocase subunit SecD
MNRNSGYRAALVVSLVLNVLLGTLVFTDWLSQRKAALGDDSTALALKSAVSAKLLPTVRFEIRVAENEQGEGLTRVTNPQTGETFFAQPTTVLVNGDIASAEAAKGTLGEPAIKLSFTPDGARKMREATERNVGKRLVFLVDGQVLTAPFIAGPVTDRATVVTGSLDQNEVTRIVLALSRT